MLNCPEKQLTTARLLVCKMKFPVSVKFTEPGKLASFCFHLLPQPINCFLLPYSVAVEAWSFGDQRGIVISAELDVQIPLLHNQPVIKTPQPACQKCSLPSCPEYQHSSPGPWSRSRCPLQAITKMSSLFSKIYFWSWAYFEQSDQRKVLDKMKGLCCTQFARESHTFIADLSRRQLPVTSWTRSK